MLLSTRMTPFVVLVLCIGGASTLLIGNKFHKVIPGSHVTGELRYQFSARSSFLCSSRCLNDLRCLAYWFGAGVCRIIHLMGETNFTSTNEIQIYLKEYDGHNLINMCASEPCQNGGTCDGDYDSYTCICPTGFTGINCQTNIDECSGSPCHNGGTCVDGINSYTCSCLPGYTGLDCETDVDECSGSPCQNGGACTDEINFYTCTCSTGFMGNNCQINIDDCPATNPCQNGGACVDGINTYTCACAPGFNGNNCEMNIDECAGNPCKNCGTGEDGINSYQCTCPAGYNGHSGYTRYSGNTCETVLTLTCPHGRPWTPPTGWPSCDKPVYYHDFETLDCVTLNNGAKQSTGKVLNGVLTDGSNLEWVSLGDLSNLTCLADPSKCPTTGFLGETVLLWVKMIDCIHSDPIITSSGTHSSPGFEISCQNNKAFYGLTLATGFFVVSSPGYNLWTHVSIVYKGLSEGIAVYINGNLHGTGTTLMSYSLDPAPLSGTVWIGRNYRPYYTSVVMDELMFWSRQMTQSEITTIMNMAS